MDAKIFDISEKDISRALEEDNILSNASVEKISEGKNSAAFKCENLIVRVPKEERAIEGYEKEDKYSKLIRGHNFEYFDKKIPMIDVVHNKSFNYAVHREIEGKTFKKNTSVGDDNTYLDQLSKSQQKKLAVKLGEFLANLHKIPLDNVTDEVDKVQKSELPYKADDASQKRNKEILGRYGINYEPLNTFNEDIVLSHNDLHGGNIAINPESENVLSGVFDLGEMGKNSREKDFMSLYIGTNRKFMRDLVQSYNLNSDKQISMKELDHYYMNKMVGILDYFQENNPDKKGLVEKDLASFKADVEAEKVEKRIENVRNRIGLKNGTQEVGNDTKVPHEQLQDLSKTDFKTLKMYREKKQNG